VPIATEIHPCTNFTVDKLYLLEVVASQPYETPLYGVNLYRYIPPLSTFVVLDKLVEGKDD